MTIAKEYGILTRKNIQSVEAHTPTGRINIRITPLHPLGLYHRARDILSTHAQIGSLEVQHTDGYSSPTDADLNSPADASLNPLIDASLNSPADASLNPLIDASLNSPVDASLNSSPAGACLNPWAAAELKLTDPEGRNVSLTIGESHVLVTKGRNGVHPLGPDATRGSTRGPERDRKSTCTDRSQSSLQSTSTLHIYNVCKKPLTSNNNGIYPLG